MKTHTPALNRSLHLLAIIALTSGALLLSIASRAQNVSEVARSGPYTINLKVLPAESFHGMHAEMMHDSGAPAVAVDGTEHPNHHLVVFVKKDGKPVEDAKVTIAYRQSAWKQWKELPVARMHVAGKGPDTTHYGNNVNLKPGNYEVRVTVNGQRFAAFRITLS
jgi:hypothetical protein